MKYLFDFDIFFNRVENLSRNAHIVNELICFQIVVMLGYDTIIIITRYSSN